VLRIEDNEDIDVSCAERTAFRSPRRLFAFEMLGEPTQNPTDDFDFVIATTAGPKYLELMEMHFAGIGSSLPTGQYMYEPYQVADYRLVSSSSSVSRHPAPRSRREQNDGAVCNRYPVAGLRDITNGRARC
jgi:hypothetical protein